MLLKKFEKITKKIYLKQHQTYFKSGSYKRFLNTYSDPSSYGLKRKHFTNAKIVDLGCGSTGYLQKAMENLNCNSVTCCDLGQKYITDLKKFEKKYIKKKNFLKYKSQNILKLDFDDNSFDVVFLNGVAMHLENLSSMKKSFLEAQRICKKNGYIWIYAGVENRNGIIENFFIPAIRNAYFQNKLFKKFIDNLDENTIKYFINFYKKKLNNKDFNEVKKFIEKYITIESLVFFQNVIQVPKNNLTKISYDFIKKALNKCSIKKTRPLNFKRKDFRKFFQPFHSGEDIISKIFYDKHLHILAKKNIS